MSFSGSSASKKSNWATIRFAESLVTGSPKKKGINIVDKIISDTCEALIGAIYLDHGFLVVEKFINRLWQNHLRQCIELQIDAKTKLQEYSLKKFKSLPVYKLISSLGPKHKPVFKVSVKLKDNMSSISIGNSKKDAQQSAANELIKKIQDIWFGKIVDIYYQK